MVRKEQSRTTQAEHKKCLAYTAQTSCDKNGYVFDTVIVPGNVHDSVSFDPLYDRLTAHLPHTADQQKDHRQRENTRISLQKVDEQEGLF